MLKLTYTENGFYLEQLSQSLEDWIKGRVVLALRSATSIFVEPTTASFLLPIDLPYLEDLEKLAQQDYSGGLSLSICDQDYVEVCLNGTWVVSEPESEEGIFVLTMSDRAEFFLLKLWKEAQAMTSVSLD